MTRQKPEAPFSSVVDTEVNARTDRPRVRSATHRFEAFEVGLEVIRSLRPLLPKLRRCDSDLARQIRKAASSAALNTKEGGRRVGADRKHHFRVALGSADEVDAALWVAEAWGDVTVDEIDRTLVLLDRQCGLLYGLTKS